MKLKFLRSKFAAFAASTALCASLSASARAADVNWVGQSTYPNWDTVHPFNWDTDMVPTGSDNAIFPSAIPFTGNQVFLTNAVSTNPLPIAANLEFNGNWSIFGGSGAAPGSGDPLVSTLTLTQGTVTVNGSSLAIIDAIIDLPNGGTLTKQGPGLLGLFQRVNGNVAVQAGGLGGIFAVSGNLVNNAILGAGSGVFNGQKVSISTANLTAAGVLAGAFPSQVTAALNAVNAATGNITIGGNFTQGKSGGLIIPIADTTPQGTSQIVVKGTATLAGAASAVYVNGFVPKDGDKFTIITAGGDVKGTFDLVDALNGPDLFATYNKNSVVLTVGAGGAITSFSSQAGTLNGNQQAITKNLIAVANDPAYLDAFKFIFNQGVKNYKNSVNSISPDSVTSNHSAGAASSTIHGTNTQARMDALHAGFSGFGDMGATHTTGDTSSGFSAQGLAVNGDGPSYNGPIAFRTGAAGPRGDDGKESKEMKAVAPEENRWGAFLSGTGQWVNVGDTEAARGYNLDSGGFTLGVDYKVTPNFAIGLMGGYTGTTVDLADNGRTWINGGMIGLYATTFVGGWYADTAVTGGYNSYSTRRSALGGDARSNTEGGDLNVLFGTGYDFHTGALTIGPTASFNYTYTGVNGFDEHGSLIPLNVNSSHTQSERTAVGFKASYDVKMGGSAIFRPELRAAWQHEFGDVSTTLSSSFAAGGGGTFDVAGPEIGRDSLLLGAGFAVQFNERCTTFLYYDGELARTNYISSAVTGGIRLSF